MTLPMMWPAFLNETNGYILVLFVFSVLFIYLVMSFYHRLDRKKEEELVGVIG